MRSDSSIATLHELLQIAFDYDFGDLWRHQVRFEGIQPIREKKIYPVCVGGACASPPEDCGGPEAYMKQMDHHRWNAPLDELELVAETVGRVLDSQGHERIRDVLGTPRCSRRSS